MVSPVVTTFICFVLVDANSTSDIVSSDIYRVITFYFTLLGNGNVCQIKK